MVRATLMPGSPGVFVTPGVCRDRPYSSINAHPPTPGQVFPHNSAKEEGLPHLGRWYQLSRGGEVG